MVLINYKETNLAKWQLSAWISAAQTTINLNAWEWDLFPSIFPFMIKLEQYDSTSTLENKPVLKREIVQCTNRVWDILTVVRGFESCPASDTATTQTTTAFAFDANDYVFHIETAGTQKDIKDELVRLETDKLNILDYISWDKLFKDSTTGTDAYQVNIPEITSYAQIDWQALRIRVDVGNTADATLEINGLWAKDIVKFKDNTLITWDVSAWQVIFVIYNANNDNFEIKNSVDQSSSVVVEKFMREVVLWEDIQAWDWKWAVFFGKQALIDYTWWLVQLNIGSVAWEELNLTQDLDNNIVQSWEITWWFTEIWTTASDLTITFHWIKNTNTTMPLTKAQATSTFDIAALYKAMYGEWLIWDWHIDIVISVDTPDATNYYTVDVTKINGDSTHWYIAQYPWSWADIGGWFTASAAQDGMFYKEYYTDVESDSDLAALRIKINWTVIYQQSWFPISTTRSVQTLPINTIIYEWDVISVEWQGNTWTVWIIRHSGTHNVYSTTANQHIEDWLENDKVWLSNINFTDTLKSDWVVIESWVAWESKQLVYWWSLTQTSSSINSLNYLSWSSGEFSSTKPAISPLFVLWRWETPTSIKLYINETNAWKDILDWIDLVNNTIYQAETDGILLWCWKAWASSTFAIELYTDSLNASTRIVTTYWANWYWSDYQSIVLPIKKWNYYKCNIAIVWGGTWPTIEAIKFYPLAID